MPLFEVFIPGKPGTDNKAKLVKVNASSWLLALRTGLRQAGEQGDNFNQVLCENRPDGTVLVKDPTARRMFRIREIEGEAQAVDPKKQEEMARQQEEIRAQAELAAKQRQQAQKELNARIAEQQAAEEAVRRQSGTTFKAVDPATQQVAEQATGDLQQKANNAAQEAAKHAAVIAKKRGLNQEQIMQAAKLAAARAAEEVMSQAVRESAVLEKPAAVKPVAKAPAPEPEAKAPTPKATKEEIAARQKAAQAAMERAKAEKELAEKQRREKQLRTQAEENAEGVAEELEVMYTDEVPIEEEEEPHASVTWSVDSMLSDMFMETMDIYDMDEDEAVHFILKLAGKVVEAEAASVILSDVNSALADLYFAAANGPVSEEIKQIRIPRGKGIVGMSVQLGVPVAVSDVASNSNFYRTADEKTGFQTRSLLCIPLTYGERTLGALELINKKGNNYWAQEELNVLSFLSQKLGEHLGRFHDEVSLDLD